MMSSALTSHDSFFFFFFNDTATTEIYTLSLHDALPISGPVPGPHDRRLATGWHPRRDRRGRRAAVNLLDPAAVDRLRRRSEEHTSELQSPCNLVCRLLLEKKKKKRSIKSLHTPHSLGTQ